jgi:hypothetical protein
VVLVLTAGLRLFSRRNTRILPNERRRWRKDSIFGDGPRVTLCREQRAQYRAKLHLQRKPGRLTIAAAHIGRILVDSLGQDGRLDPSHATLAARAGVAMATVRRALEQLRCFGFLDWTRRLVRSAGTGWRCEQDSNAYVLQLPSCEVHFARGVNFLRFKKESRREEGPSWAAVQEAQGALARVRKAAESRLLGAWTDRAVL